MPREEGPGQARRGGGYSGVSGRESLRAEVRGDVHRRRLQERKESGGGDRRHLQPHNESPLPDSDSLQSCFRRHCQS
ncbi:unnamed protein product [Linum tenue]|uniref:Uncharacterized protein n=1 Tax=Linum tenue TaxID=586396 RepID=A0AAV0GUT0_9ROSI|nr:unnamed protein product [Linum tenue]